MNQFHWSERDARLRKIATVKFDPRKFAEPLGDSVQIELVDINADGLLCDCAVNMLKTVATSYSEHGDTFRKTANENMFEQFGQHCQLLYADGVHMSFVVFDGDG